MTTWLDIKVGDVLVQTQPIKLPNSFPAVILFLSIEKDPRNSSRVRTVELWTYQDGGTSLVKSTFNYAEYDIETIGWRLV